MKLLRIVALKLTPPPSPGPQTTLVEDDVAVQFGPSWEVDGGVFTLVLGSLALARPPKRTSKGDLVVPERSRRRVMAAIEHTVNLTAVAHGAARNLVSPPMYVAFVPESDADRTLLDSARGIHGAGVTAQGGFAPRLALGQPLFERLDGRNEAVALLAEAQASQHLTGRLHELVRFFERAFSAPASKLAPLVAAHAHEIHGYTEEEANYWFDDLRNPATHGDQRNDVVLETDVRPHIARMEQAAMDVLLNKLEWRSLSTQRREPSWLPAFGTRNRQGDQYGFADKRGAVTAAMSDQWGELPVTFSLSGVTITEAWPSRDAWPRQVTQPLEVLPVPEGVVVIESPAEGDGERDGGTS